MVQAGILQIRPLEGEHRPDSRCTQPRARLSGLVCSLPPFRLQMLKRTRSTTEDAISYESESEAHTDGPKHRCLGIALQNSTEIRGETSH